MSAEDHKALACRFVEEVINGNNLEVVDELFAPGFQRTVRNSSLTAW